jgi:hypothetical protein
MDPAVTCAILIAYYEVRDIEKALYVDPWMTDKLLNGDKGIVAHVQVWVS